MRRARRLQRADPCSARRSTEIPSRSASPSLRVVVREHAASLRSCMTARRTRSGVGQYAPSGATDRRRPDRRCRRAGAQPQGAWVRRVSRRATSVRAAGRARIPPAAGRAPAGSLEIGRGSTTTTRPPPRRAVNTRARLRLEEAAASADRSRRGTIDTRRYAPRSRRSQLVRRRTRPALRRWTSSSHSSLASQGRAAAGGRGNASRTAATSPRRALDSRSDDDLADPAEGSSAPASGGDVAAPSGFMRPAA